MSHTLLRSKADKRSLGRYAKPAMELIEVLADCHHAAQREKAKALCDDIKLELIADEIVSERKEILTQIRRDTEKI